MYLVYSHMAISHKCNVLLMMDLHVFLLSGRKIARNVMTMATGEVAPAAEVGTTELPEVVKTVQEAVRSIFHSLFINFRLSM